MKVVLVCLCVLLSCSVSVYAASGERPNVLLILVDDLRTAIGAYGDPVAITPNIDKLASKGMVFSKAYTNQAVCGPSRTNLLMGQRSTSSGIYFLGQNFRDYDHSVVTLPEVFKKHGYHTEAMGKVFHIGHGGVNDEPSWSVPHYHDLIIEYVDSLSKPDGFTKEEALFANHNAHGLPKGLAWESPDVPDEAYADGRVAARAVSRLQQLKIEQKKNPSSKFFLAVGFARPHLPFSVPLKYWKKYNPNELPLAGIQKSPKGAPGYAGKRDIEIDQYLPIPSSKDHDPFPLELQRKLIHGYYASVSYVDSQIGKVLNTLEELGLEENTIVVFWSDHGYHLGELGIWTKHVNYELANRIPLIIYAPGEHLKQGATEQLAETVDIYPTLLDLAGLDTSRVPQTLDGLSMAPVLKNPDSLIRDHAYHCFPRGDRLGRAIRTDRYRMVEWKHHLGDGSDVEYELYDYSTGAVETENVALKQQEVLEELKWILETHPPAHPFR